MLEEYKAMMIRPRSILEKQGIISNNEKKIHEDLKRIRGCEEMPYKDDPNLNGHLVPMDSLIESAFNTERNAVWGKYKMST
jgi:hypothetical protein